MKEMRGKKGRRGNNLLVFIFVGTQVSESFSEGIVVDLQLSYLGEGFC